MRELRVVKLLDRLENAAGLDPLADRVTSVVNAVIRPRSLRDLLHGVPAGHPLHPVAVMIPIGAWTSVAILDIVPGRNRAAQTLVGAGLLGVGPAVASGFTDWSELHEQQKRVGLVHAAANVVASGFYLASYAKRRSGGSGKLLALAGLAVVSASGFIGGHLSYRQAAGANHAEDVPHLFPTGWHRLARLDSLTDGEPTSMQVGGVPLFALRRGEGVDVLSNVCSHLSGPLSDGDVKGSGADACIACPWHGSEFSIRTGEVVHGPATAPQPRFDTRIVDGVVEVSLPGAG
ncbi:Rieske 2Fe-2S domain-containing protein [Frondihabitans peucedani]|jgi:nitrite reductase/ring-hydroxylating ferredoxin subunit/uncharacterized membrane protein|uniref:Rieske domain-containing protein n=1 Tax=Frondihabitans peucedani TaxID=598626 RepID=A0ABP8E5R4_9MICO